MRQFVIGFLILVFSLSTLGLPASCALDMRLDTATFNPQSWVTALNGDVRPLLSQAAVLKQGNLVVLRYLLRALDTQVRDYWDLQLQLQFKIPTLSEKSQEMTLAVQYPTLHQSVTRMTQPHLESFINGLTKIIDANSNGKNLSQENRIGAAKFIFEYLQSHDIPFAKVAYGTNDTEAALELSDSIDSTLGLRSPEIEKSLAARSRESLSSQFQNERTYAGISPRALQTPYIDFIHIIKSLDLKAGQTIVDIGSAYGRLGFYLGLARPDLNFIGYEIVPERNNEALRVAADLHIGSHIKFIERNLGDPHFLMPEADVYFAFAPTSPETFNKIVGELAPVAERKNLILATVNDKSVSISIPKGLKRVGQIDGARRTSLWSFDSIP